MFHTRRECTGCGIRFTPESETQKRCGECPLPNSKPQSDAFVVPDANGERVDAEEYW